MNPPAAATEDNDEDNEDTEGTSGHTNDDGQLLGIRNMNARSSEGQSDILLCHSPVVDCHTRVLTQVIAGHRSHRQTKVSFNTAWKIGFCQNMLEYIELMFYTTMPQSIVMLNLCCAQSE